MIKKFTHLAFSILIGVVAWKYFSAPGYGMVFIVTGSMIPDLDMFFPQYHRKMLHNFFALIGMTVLLFLLSSNFLLAQLFAIGCLGHFLLDSLTEKGVWWLGFGGRIHGSLRTGGFLDRCFFICFLALAVAIAAIQ
ncbi:MAG: metal-dependent hydrolase [Candidatus Bathyarchaeia archaeon]